MSQVITKSYEAFLGLDLRASDLRRPVEKASISENCVELDTNTLTVRPGYQTLMETLQAMGEFTYKRFDPVTNVTTEEVIAVAENLYRKKKGVFTITFTPSSGGGEPGTGGGTGFFGGGFFGDFFGGGFLAGGG